MRFLYKIYSGYDGFAPRRIPQRLLEGHDLDLGWQRYLDSVDVGDEVWIYFHGPHRFTPGVYVQGFVRTVDPDQHRLRLRVRRFSTDRPLTDAEASRRIGDTVSVRNRQVFLFPEHWLSAPNCTLHGTADSCGKRMCDQCTTWRSLPLIKPAAFALPHRMPGDAISGYAPAYWVIPSRCYLHRIGTVAPTVRRTSDVFMRFKVGAEELAYPLALGMYTSLTKQRRVAFDAVVPIPLSPDKEAAGEIHRTRLLAKELARLLGTRVAEVLTLQQPISKHRLRIHNGMSATSFERRYAEALQVDASKVRSLRQVLVIDDVCTEGSTLRCAVRALRSARPDLEVTLSTAGQMIVKSVVTQQAPLLV